MIEILFSLVFLCVILIFIRFMFIGIVKSKKTLNIMNVTISFVVLFNMLGFPVLIWKQDAYRAEFVTDMDTLFVLFIMIILSTVFFLLGYNVVNYKNLNIERIIVVSYTRAESNLSLLLCSVVFMFVGIMSLYAYISYFGFDALPIVLAVTSNSSDVTLARSITGADFENYSWYQLGMHDFLLLGVGMYFVWFFRSANFKLMKLVFMLILIALLLFAFGINGEKGKFIDVILFFIVLANLLGLLTINVSTISLVAVMCVAILVPAYWLMMGDSSLFSSIKGILSRTLTGQLQAGYHHLEFYQELPSLYYGLTYPNPKGIFAFEPVAYTRELMQWVHGAQYIGSTKVSGSMPTHFWGELFLNFGAIGMIIFSMTIGMWIKFLDDCFKGISSQNSIYVLYAWLIVHYKDLAYTGASNFIIDKKLVLILLSFFLLSILSLPLRTRN